MNPSFDEVKALANLRDLAESSLERRGPDTYVCPACGSGTGPNHSAALSIDKDGNRWKCFSCGAGGDVFDLWGALHGTDNRREQLEGVAEWAGVDLHRADQAAPSPTGQQQTRRAPGAAWVERARAALDDQTRAYLTGRGFTPQEVEQWGFGAVDGFQDLRGRCLVVPYPGTDGYHAVRALQPTDKGHTWRKALSRDWGAEPIFAASAIERENRPDGALVVVESQLCAISCACVGHRAIAVGGSGGIRKALRALEGFKGTVVALMDCDGAGDKANADLAAGLQAQGVRCVVANRLPDGCKDPNELFQRDREALRAFLSAEKERPGTQVESGQDSPSEGILARLRGISVFDGVDVAAEIFEGRAHEDPIPTGLAGLDRVLGGGLRSGLCVLGATSSMGKTTLCVQVADQIAASGRPVLFATIEQSKEEIVAKSLGRMASECGEPWPVEKVTRGASALSAADRSHLAQACERYSQDVAPRLHVMEPDGRPTVAEVERAALCLRELHEGLAPVVIIDYLQLLAPQDPHMDVRAATDANLAALRQLARRKLHTPVILISSLNRSSYSGCIELDSFKESGAIEYSSDILLGLQPLHIEDAKDAKREVRRVKALADRPCEIVVLKNRSGRVSDGIPVTFHAAAGRFTDGAACRERKPQVV